MSFGVPPHESFEELAALDERRKELEARRANERLVAEDGVGRAPLWLRWPRALWLRLTGR